MANLTQGVARGHSPAVAVAIVVVTGPDSGQRFELTRGSALVGSLDTCDLVLTDPTVSRQHLRLELLDDGLKATDLKSRNGVYFNGSRLSEAHLPLGARLKLGDTELRIDALDRQRPAPGTQTEYHGLAGSSAAMREVISTVQKVAPTRGTVLIQGETGTGKEVAARAIHRGSGRKGELVVFDCGAASPGVIASELFGHVRGAFTDARTDRPGAAVDADGGTLFLDEIGELDLSLQASLLRLLENQEVKPVGGGKSRKVDVRVVAATNRDLQAEVEAGRFREDLLFRLAVVTVVLPPLRERLDDLPVLARRVLDEARLELELSDDTLAILRSYTWPGNVRELKNVLFRTATLGGAPDLAAGKLPSKPPPVSSAAAAAAPAREPAIDDDLPADYRRARESLLSRFERQYIKDLLEKSGGNVSQAARTAGIARAHMYRLLNKHGLQGE
ncbi:MAG: sigma 54-interacting transcriptional regulator [Archangiaceae bacterium]|nr:sigma 54-interacting transcriptional regulator [Archangiaceae bacterium]